MYVEFFFLFFVFFVWNYYFISARWLPPLRINKVNVKVKARKQLERNHGDQNKQERGRLITVEDYKNGSKHQTSEEIESFAKRTFLC